MTLKIVELFAGIGSQYQALKNIGIDTEVVGISEWDIPCLISYDTIHNKKEDCNLSKEEILEKLKGFTFSSDGKKPTNIKSFKVDKLRQLYTANKNNKNLGSILDVKGIDVPKHDLLTYSFPCFTENTLVLTNIGYKKINEIKVGDNVLTHTNTYKKVLNTYDQGIKEIWEIIGSGIDRIETTENHKFLIRTKITQSHRRRRFTQPYWKECYELTNKDYLGVAINNNSIIPTWEGIDFEWKDGRKTRHKDDLSLLMDNEDFWWVIGRYIGDGWVRFDGGIIICCEGNDDNELNEIIEKLKIINFTYNIVRDKTTYKIHIPKKEIELFVSQFGKYAHGKKLTNTIIDLPINLLKSFIIGYHSADGSTKLHKHRISSVSRELIYGIAQCISKVYNIPYSIYRDEPNNRKHMIGDRIINQSTNYTVSYNFSTALNRKAFYEDGYVWFPITKISNTLRKENVYDIEVDTDHTFTANGCITHNCQDLSNQGKSRGLYAGKSSSLLWQVGRLLEELNTLDKLPKYLLMENVPAIFNDTHKPGFDIWKDQLIKLGYKNWDFKLKSSYFNIPQNRDRAYMVSILNGTDYNIPNQNKLTDLRIKDIMDDNVDSKFYMKDLSQFYPKNINVEPTNTGIRGFNLEGYTNFTSEKKVYHMDSISCTITATGAQSRVKVLLEDGRIRILTPRECWKMMGFTDQHFNKVDGLFIDSILTKQAGNSIVVNVLEAIFTNMFLNKKS